MARFVAAERPQSGWPTARDWLIAMVAVVLFAIASSAMGQPRTLTGRVIAVIDGDTIDILEDNYKPHRIRFAWTDAPESKQDFGQVSKRVLAALVANKRVTVVVFKEDRYESKYGKRLIGSVFLNGQDVGLAMVQLGAVWHYGPVSVDQAAPDRALYEKAQFDARAARVGLWQDARATAPWLWRREHADDPPPVRAAAPHSAPHRY